MGTTRKNAAIATLNDGSPLGAVAVTTKSNSTAQQEDVKPILQNMLQREKHNELDVKRLKQLVSTISARNIGLKVTVKATEESTRQLSCDVLVLRSAIRDFKERLALNAKIDTSSFQTCKKSLAELLEQGKVQVVKGEKQRAELEAAPKPDLVVDAELAVRRGELARMAEKRKELVDELKRLEKSWLKALVNALRSEMKRETRTPFVGFNDGFSQIIELMDSIQQTRKEHEKLKEAFLHTEQEKQKLHAVFHARLEVRRDLEVLPLRVGSQLDQIAQKRGPNVKSVPERNEDLVLTVGRLIDWIQNELQCGKRQLDDMKKTAATSSAKLSDKSKNFEKQLEAKKEEVRKLADAVKKAEDEGKDLHGRAEQTKKHRKTQQRQLSVEFSTWTLASNKVLATRRDSLMAESRKSDEEAQNNATKVVELRLKRQHIDEEFCRLNEKLRDRKLESDVESREYQTQLKALNEALEYNQQWQSELHKKTREVRDTLKASLPDRSALPQDTQLEKLEKLCRQLHVALEKSSHDTDALRLAVANTDDERRQLSDQLLPRLVANDNAQSELDGRSNDLDGKRQRLRAEADRNDEHERELRHLQVTTLYGDHQTTAVTKTVTNGRQTQKSLADDGHSRPVAEYDRTAAANRSAVLGCLPPLATPTKAAPSAESSPIHEKGGCSLNANEAASVSRNDDDESTVKTSSVATATSSGASATSTTAGRSFVFEIRPEIFIELKKIDGSNQTAKQGEDP